jgi:predicted ATPase
VQDAAYRTLLRSKRQALHARIVEVLEERFAETVETQPEILAHHCTQARLITRAVDYLRRAGELAAKRSATTGAIAQFRKGLDLLHGLPDNPQRWSQELELWVALGGALMAAKGFAAKESGEAWGQARELCRQLSETSQLPRVLYGQYVFHLVRAEPATAFDVGTELLELGRQRRNTDLPVMGHRAVGNASFELGQLVPAREHLDRALALYDRAWNNALAYLYGFDPRVAVLSYLAWTLFALGYPDQALARSREAVTIARETSHLASLAFAQFFHCALGQLSRRDEAEVRTEAETLVRLASEQGFQYWLAGGTVLGGWALARSGEPEAGLAQLHRGLADWRATGAEHFLPHFLTLAADAYGQVGRLTKGLDLLQEAVSRVKRSGERWYEAELYRFKAKLLMTGSDHHEAETCLRRALTVARAQDARAWELRAAIDLARLWHAQGKSAEARNLLTPIYDWFSEGCDTPDLKDAKALLDELRE